MDLPWSSIVLGGTCHATIGLSRSAIQSGGPVWRNGLALVAVVGLSAKTRSQPNSKFQPHRNRDLGGEEGPGRRRREHETGVAYEGE
jgi:hypothetical protein